MSPAPRLRRWILEISTTIEDDTGILRVEGRLGARDAGVLVEAAAAAFARGARDLLLDVSGVDYIDSAGVMAVQAVAGRAAVHGGSALLYALSDALRATLAVAPGLLDVPIVSTLDEARAMAQGQRLDAHRAAVLPSTDASHSSRRTHRG